MAGGLALGLTGAFLLTQQVVVYKLQQILHPIRAGVYEMRAETGASFRRVTFTTSDHISLNGWYLPSTNGAAIILQHGYRANSLEMLPAGLLLAKHGYGVLMFDFRGHGQSGDGAVTFGLDEKKDTDAAVTFLQTQADVTPERIGILGNSMGGATAIFASAENVEIKAVAVESVFAELKDEVGIGIHLQTGLPARPLDSIF